MRSFIAVLFGLSYSSVWVVFRTFPPQYNLNLNLVCTLITELLPYFIEGVFRMSHFRMSRFYILEFYYLPISGVTRFRCQLLENNIIFRTAHLLIGQASAARSQLIKSWNIEIGGPGKVVEIDESKFGKSMLLFQFILYFTINSYFIREVSQEKESWGAVGIWRGRKRLCEMFPHTCSWQNSQHTYRSPTWVGFTWNYHYFWLLG